MMRRFSSMSLSLALALAVTTGAACGEDDEGSTTTVAPAAPRPPGAPGAPGLAGRGGRGGPGGAGEPAALKIYKKVEEVVPPDEAGSIRAPFEPRDFAADMTGNDNRDPFRSYVVRQTINSSESGGGVTVATTEVCTARNMVAPDPKSKDPRARKSYSMRDLRLAGIVMRGTRGFAIFRDPSGYGHLVRKGDCVGKEKARVTTIGAHIVKVEVIPEPGPNQLTQEPQERKFELYQDEIPLDEDLSDAEEERQ